MNKFFRSAAILLLGIFPFITSFANTGDFTPSRSGFDVGSHRVGSDRIEFNRFTDSIPLAYFAGNCPDPNNVCQRVNGTQSCTLREFRSVLTNAEVDACFNSNVSDERDFIKAGLLRGAGAWPFSDSLVSRKTLVEGDQVRFLIYAHNNGTEGNSSLVARNTTATINWSDIEKVKGSIFASNAVPNTINDTTTLAYANDDLILEPAGNAFYMDHKQGTRHIDINPSSQTDTSQTFSFGDFQSSYGNFHILYVDFNVVGGVRDAEIVKSSDPVTTTLVQRGSDIDYTLTITNTGTLPLTNTVVSDPLDPNLTFVEAPSTVDYAASHANGLVRFVLNQDFLPGESIDLNFKARVNLDTPNNAIIRNKGSLDADGLPTKESNETEHPVAPIVDFNANKRAFNTDFTDEITEITVGQTYGYEIQIQSTVDQDVTADFVIKDRLPAELEFVEFVDHVSTSGTNYNVTDQQIDARNLMFTFDELKANDTIKLRFLVRATELPDNAQVGNVCRDNTKYNNLAWAIAYIPGSDQTVAANRIKQLDFCHPLTPVERIQPTSTKKAFDTNFTNEISTIGLDQNFGYEIAVTNNNDFEYLADFLIKDNFAKELDFVEFVDAVSDNGVDYGVNAVRLPNMDTNKTKHVQFSWPNLEANDTLRLRFIVKAVETPVETSYVLPNHGCPTPTNYNNGAWIFAFIPGAVQNNANELYQKDVCAEVVPNPSPTITKEAFADYADTPITGAFSLNDEYVYKITISNDTPNNINGVIRFDDTLPVELDYVSQQATNNPQIVATNDFLTAQFGTTGTLTLTPGQERVFRFTVKIVQLPDGNITTTTDVDFDPLTCRRTTTTTNQNNQIVNEVQLFHNDVSVVSEIDDDCVIIEILGNPSITKEAFADYADTPITGAFTLGEEYVYKITVSNDTPNNINGVIRFDDTLPVELDYVSQQTTNSPQITANNDFLSAQFGTTGTLTLTPGQERVFRFTVKIVQLPNGDITTTTDTDFNPTTCRRTTTTTTTNRNNEIVNEVELFHNDVSITSEIDDDCVIVPVISFTADKEAYNTDFTDTIETVSIGDEFGYEIAVTNNGTTDITDDFRIVDTLPADVEFVEFVIPATSDQSGSYSPAAFGPFDNGRTLVFNHNGLDAGDTIRHRFIVRAVTIPTAGQTFTNMDGNPANCPDPTKYNNGAIVQLFNDGTRPPFNEDPTNSDDQIGNNFDLCEVVTPQTGVSISAEKNAVDPTIFATALSQVALGGTIGYEIEVSNLTATDITDDFVVTDILPAEVTFASFATHVSDSGAAVNVTNTQVDSRNLRFTFNGLEANDTVRLRFTVVATTRPTAGQTFDAVDGSPSSCTDTTKYNNGATVQRFNAGSDTTNPSNQIGDDIDLCEPVSITTPGGTTPGGSGSVNPSIGACTLGNGGGYMCTNIRPDEKLPGYTWYEKCLDANTQDKRRCTDEWFKNFGAQLPLQGTLKRCDNLLGSVDLDKHCAPDKDPDNPLIPGATASCTEMGSASILKQVSSSEIISFGEQACVPQGEKATYQVTVTLPAVPGDVTSAKLELNDFTIPYSSGWTWARGGASNAKVIIGGTETTVDATPVVDGYGFSTGGIQFIYDFLNANLLESGTTVVYEYEIDTTLAAESDICQIDNVAYAVLEYTVLDSATGTSSNITNGIGDKSCEPLTRKRLNTMLGQAATDGDRSRLCIARPFIQARGGSNVGVNFSSTSDKAKVFGSDFADALTSSSGQPIEALNDLASSTITNSEFLTGGAADETYGGSSLVDFNGLDEYAGGNGENYKSQIFLNAVPGNKFGGSGEKSQVSEAYKFNSLTIGKSTPYTVDAGTTIFVENDLTISDNFKVQGPGFVAFIVGGNINVDESVTQMDGIFFTQGGKITSTDINKDDQLEINGGIMGDADNLLSQRLYIGDNPTVTLEPAVLVRYDLRLLSETPPGIEFFLGQSWKEGLE